MTMRDPFQPPWPFTEAFLQTLLASSRLRTLGQNKMQAVAEERIIRCKNGVRLQGAVSVPSGVVPKAMVIILHGWEGSIGSTYVLQTGKHLYNCGYSVYRLNLRDHGRTHHLNQGLFFGTLLDEVYEAVSLSATETHAVPMFLVGFSLGGNFALRIARHMRRCPIHSLRHIVAISPVLDPDKTTDCIDNNPLLQYYFLRKWIRSLKLKQSFFPEHYDFSQVLTLGNIRLITETLIPQYTHFKNASEYFKGYTLSRSDLERISTPTTILTAADDPIIPVSDFLELKLSPHTQLVIQPHGGHNGFIESVLLSCWYERKLAELFDRTLALS